MPAINRGWARLEAGALISIWISHVGDRDPSYLSHHLLAPRVCISKRLNSELELELKNQGTAVRDRGVPIQVLIAAPNVHMCLPF